MQTRSYLTSLVISFNIALTLTVICIYEENWIYAYLSQNLNHALFKGRYKNFLFYKESYTFYLHWASFPNYHCSSLTALRWGLSKNWLPKTLQSVQLHPNITKLYPNSVACSYFNLRPQCKKTGLSSIFDFSSRN